MKMQQLEILQEKINYKFNNVMYLKRALTHSSYANENKKEKVKNNERLEFLGDSVLGLVVSEYLYSHFPNLAEGQLTKVRARIVCEASLGDTASDLDIGSYMYFGRGEELTGGRERTSILADTFEALLAAMYIDGGIEIVRNFVLTQMDEIIMDAVEGKLFIDYKTRLQEVIQVKKGNRIKYEIFKEEGPDHSKIFFTHVKLNEAIIGIGKGRSKKESEQAAAREGLKTLKEIS